MPELTPVEESGSRTLVLDRQYPDPIEDVWSAFTTSERLGRWFGTFTGEGGAGGSVSLTITGEVDAGGAVAEPVTVNVRECEPPRRLVVDIPENSDRSWLVAVTLAPSATGTTVRFEQRLPEGLGLADVEAGWNWYLDRLGAVLAGTPMPDWKAYEPREEVG